MRIRSVIDKILKDHLCPVCRSQLLCNGKPWEKEEDPDDPSACTIVCQKCHFQVDLADVLTIERGLNLSWELMERLKQK